MLRFIYVLILFFLILLFSSFAIINRDIVLVNFNFLSLFDANVADSNMFLVMEVPLFLVVFIAGLIGMLVGMLLPIMHFFRKLGFAWKRKLNRPLKAPPPRSFDLSKHQT